MSLDLENINPKLYQKCEEREVSQFDEDDDVVDEFDAREIFDLIRNVNDPEHPLSLEQLNVVDLESISMFTAVEHALKAFKSKQQLKSGCRD